MRGANRAGRHQLAVDRGCGDLAGLAPHFVHARVERGIATLCRVQRERTGHHGRLHQALGHEQAVQRQRRRDLGAVDQRQALFRRQHHRRDAGRLERVIGFDQFPIDAHRPHAQHGQRHVRQRRQIARCAHRALGWNGRHDASVVQGDQGIDDQGTHAGEAARQAADFHQHDQAHHRVRQQFAGTDRVRQDQIALQFFQLLVRDAGFGKNAETGVDAVGGVALGDDGLDRRGRGLDHGVARRGQRQRRRARPDAAQVVEGHFSGMEGPTGRV